MIKAIIAHKELGHIIKGLQEYEEALKKRIGDEEPNTMKIIKTGLAEGSEHLAELAQKFD